MIQENDIKDVIIYYMQNTVITQKYILNVRKVH